MFNMHRIFSLGAKAYFSTVDHAHKLRLAYLFIGDELQTVSWHCKVF